MGPSPSLMLCCACLVLNFCFKICQFFYQPETQLSHLSICHNLELLEIQFTVFLLLLQKRLYKNGLSQFFNKYCDSHYIPPCRLAHW